MSEPTLDPAAVRFESLHIEGGHANLIVSDDPDNGVILALADAMIEMLGDAENYVECTVTPSRGSGRTGRYTMTVQRAKHPTPHELRRQAEADRDRYRAVVDAARDLVHCDPDTAQLDFLLELESALEALDGGETT